MTMHTDTYSDTFLLGDLPATKRRWIPLQDRPAMAGWGFDAPDDHPWRAIQNPAGLMLGDVGSIYLFICPSCPDRPFDYRFDCS
jgi:hypothetical protein